MNHRQHFRIHWQCIPVDIRYCRTWSKGFERSYGRAMAHLEIEQPDRRLLPLTETGYRSHFAGANDIEKAGGPVAYVTQGLDMAALDPEWQQMQAAGRQLTLL